MVSFDTEEVMMGIMPDHWIRKMAREQGMIEPFADSQVRDGVISYGVSSYGYDIRVTDEFKIFDQLASGSDRPEALRSQVDGGLSKAMSASSRPIPSPWPKPSNISASRAMC